MRGCSLLAFAFICAIATGARAQSTFTVSLTGLTDEKAVFATVESPNVVPARARIGGTVASLSVRQGDAVKEGQVIAVVGDEKLLLQNQLARCPDRRLAKSQLAQAQTELTRAETLLPQGSRPRSRHGPGAHRSGRGDARRCGRAPRNAPWRSRNSRKVRCWRRSPAAC